MIILTIPFYNKDPIWFSVVRVRDSSVRSEESCSPIWRNGWRDARNLVWEKRKRINRCILSWSMNRGNNLLPFKNNYSTRLFVPRCSKAERVVVTGQALYKTTVMFGSREEEKKKEKKRRRKSRGNWRAKKSAIKAHRATTTKGVVF